MKYITGFFRFWYDFLIGDSWQIAAGVVIVLLIFWAVLTAAPNFAELAGPLFFLALVAVFCGVLISEQKNKA